MLRGRGVSAMRMTWWFDCAGLALTYKGKSIPIDIRGMGLHGDFVARKEGDDWPTD
ncbi:MAG: DUF6547 family protein [Phycisphaeraceae bacterium]